MIRRGTRISIGTSTNWRSKWRPVVLCDESSVDQLNELFAVGWYLIRLDFDDLPMLIFFAPPGAIPLVENGQSTSKRRSHWSKVDTPVVVLRKGKRKNRQRAVYVEPERQGYKNLEALHQLVRSNDGNGLVAAVTLPSHAIIAIFEKGKPSQDVVLQVL